MRHFLLLISCAAFALRADVVECSNGDRYNGKVLLVDEQNVRLTNEITGMLVIPRSKVSTILFTSPRSPTTIATLPTSTNSLSPSKPLTADAKAIEQVQNQFLGDASPEATQMFQEMVRGLLSGKLDVTDVRSKAQSTLEQLKDLQKDLGDDDASLLLNSYASILRNFVNQAATNANPSAPKAAE